MQNLFDLRQAIDAATYTDSLAALRDGGADRAFSPEQRARISTSAATLVTKIRGHARPGLMEVFLAEYGLSTDEGIALMCLAEALLRVPDAATIDALIEDKIAPSDWSKHAGHSTSPLVNASTWALMLTGRVLRDRQPGPAAHLRGAIKRLGEPVIRTAVGRAMKEMGAQFVLGESISSAMTRAAKMEAKGYTYSYDMLGEAARTESDARRYHLSYSRAIAAISEAATARDIRDNPGISVKLSALFPRYEEAQRDAVMTYLVPRLRTLAGLARTANIGLNIDAEEADRLSLSLDVIERVLEDPSLEGWDGFGVVVQAYGHRAGPVLDWLYALADRLDRRIMVRLVKGAYWDTEIKIAQVAGLDAYPVHTTKAATDVNYILNAQKLLGMTDRIYPQFATHNAHTVAAVLDMATDTKAFEFQRLHGMGEALHEIVHEGHGTRCRIYAPVGAHRDLLAYLVRRLLENGANSSFVNQIVDDEVPPEEVARDPFEAFGNRSTLPKGTDLFLPERRNSCGWDLAHRPTLAAVEQARTAFVQAEWTAAPMLATDAPVAPPHKVTNPANPKETVGEVTFATPDTVAAAVTAAQSWGADPTQRRRVLEAAADLYETHYGELFALLAREAGKSLPDAVAELREAVDFLRYYAARSDAEPARGVFACISPWNFPLAIFTGQISAALAAGNAVLAKPAEQTSLIAARAVALLHEAGVPKCALQLLPGEGDVGAALTSNPGVDGVAFTGSTQTAQLIHRAMAENLAPGAPLIAETGGLNAMIVDSTALPEQAVDAIVESAFQSAGQRCSALRCLYVQEDIADGFTEMLTGAMDALKLGAPWNLSTDVGPVIDEEARQGIADYIEAARAEGRVVKELPIPGRGHFVPPVLIRVNSIAEMEREIFGPVLHIATFKSSDLDKVIDTINATGYGLTFGLQTRIDDRVQHVTDRIHAGNVYVNRNQIGAIVGSQPFGGEGMSGTGPKAGGPHYLPRFQRRTIDAVTGEWDKPADTDKVQRQIDATPIPKERRDSSLPGPTGELNRLSSHARPPVLCLGPGKKAADAQAALVRAGGGVGVVPPGLLDPQTLTGLTGHSGAIWWGDEAQARAYRHALAASDGPILPLITDAPDGAHLRHERHLCVDTTAAGGNTALLAGTS
ncbi:bifunctional proline dehydrogenase/L-glutamate gamma-semialdehyde dehydrogenase PutA [Primorskyibacter marinus]|uniref:bifunctional proline dehydrogenase/L-glutamate gamma-semialdehyde dehydrogenase PutA n=1 Tax=Primorskyibacter marinus TaxID=1977320 RepID=UPI000E306D92|nr:bifunctional proline dehydrogenase/L-glutamate gamma-semialdehyde dehydrogenase PutA [Primorskyibacter marinus]